MTAGAARIHHRASSAARGLWVAVLCAALVPALPARTAQARANKQVAKASKRKKADRPVLERLKDVAGGRHWRITSKNGPIHVWVPPGYDRKTAGLVIYVHGYRTTADKAWKYHKLAQQFRKSRQNAMFLVPEAPSSRDDRVYWDALGDLKKAVRRSGMRLPDGPPIAIAHSGGFRTVSHWVDNRLLAQVILLDALYGRREAFDEFIDSGKRAKHHKLIIIAADTAERSRKFAKRFPYAVIRDKFPASYKDFTKRERRSKLLYIRSQYGHGSIVTNQKVIPLILRITPLGRL